MNCVNPHKFQSYEIKVTEGTATSILSKLGILSALGQILLYLTWYGYGYGYEHLGTYKFA